MAGMVGSGGKAPPGYIWNASAGGFVPLNRVDPNSGKTYGSQAGNTGAGYSVRQDGSYDVNPGRAPAGAAPMTSMASGGRSYAPSGGGSATAWAGDDDPGRDFREAMAAQAAAWTREPTSSYRGAPMPVQAQAAPSQAQAAPTQSPNRMLQAKLEELWRSASSSPQQQVAPQMAFETGTTDADRGFLADSKERAGHRLQSGLQTLTSEMSRRGILGSGIQAANAGTLTRGAMADMAADDRELMGSKQARNRSIADQNFAARRDAFTANMGAQQSAQGRLASLLQYYGMAY